jgi:hypothetical protein
MELETSVGKLLAKGWKPLLVGAGSWLFISTFSFLPDRTDLPLNTTIAPLVRLISGERVLSRNSYGVAGQRRPPPIHHGLADFACATFGLRKTSFSQPEFADDTPGERGLIAE